MTQVRRVLVVDDDPSICDLLTLALSDDGYAVKTSPNAAEALALLEGWSADVILLDLGLPGMQASDFLTTCRAHQGNDIPTLLVSAATDAHEQAKLLGVAGALTKPFDLDQLLMAVRQLLPDARRIERELVLARCSEPSY